MLDPAIPLAAAPRPQEMPSLGDTLAQVGQIKAQQQVGQMRDLEMQGQRIDLQRKQRQMEAERVLAGAMQESVKINPDGTSSYDVGNIGRRVMNAGYGEHWPAIEAQFAESRHKIDQAKKARTDAQVAEQDLAGTWGTQAKESLDGGADPDLVAHNLASKVSLAVHDQVIAPEHAAGILAEYDPADPTSIHRVVGGLISASPKANEEASKIAARKSADEARKASEEARKEATLAKAVSNAASQLGTSTDAATYAQRWNGLPANIRSQFPSPDQWTPETAKQALQIGMTPSQIQAGRHEVAEEEMARGHLAETKRRNDIELGPLEQMQGGAPGSASAVPDVPPGQRNEAFLQTLSPGIQTQVKALVDGRLAFPSSFALKTPYWQAMLQAVGKYDPLFDAVNYNARFKTRQAFTTGKEAGQVNNLNTALGHMQELSQAVDALHNRTSTDYNTVANALMTRFGWTGKTDFDTIAPRVVQEITRLWRGSGGSEADISRDLGTINSSMAPGQAHSALATTAAMMEDKLHSLEDQYREGMGTAPKPMIEPRSQAVITRLMQRAGRVAPVVAQAPVTATTQPQGRISVTIIKNGKRDTPTFDSQADADAFIRDAKANGYQVQ